MSFANQIEKDGCGGSTSSGSSSEAPSATSSAVGSPLVHPAVRRVATGLNQAQRKGTVFTGSSVMKK